MKNSFTPHSGLFPSSRFPLFAISALVLAGALTAQKAGAIPAITVIATENGSGVTFSYSGSVTDLTNFTFENDTSLPNGVVLANGAFAIGSGDYRRYSVPISGPTVIGSGVDEFEADPSSGSPFLLVFDGTQNTIGIPQGYILGTTISGSSTYAGQTLATLGVTPGTYIWTLGNTAGDVITLNATATPVPLETDALPVVVGAVFMAGGIWWKKKRAQAKANDFIAKQ